MPRTLTSWYLNQAVAYELEESSICRACIDWQKSWFCLLRRLQKQHKDALPGIVSLEVGSRLGTGILFITKFFKNSKLPGAPVRLYRGRRNGPLR
jgi:hypothetical protein